MTQEKRNNILTGTAVGAVGVPAFMTWALESGFRPEGWGVIKRFDPRVMLLWALMGGIGGAAAGAITEDVIDTTSKGLKQLGFTKHERFIH
jgi:hypothetical protein